MKRPAEIRILQAFVTVAREGNISRAAEMLNLTQPAISLQLKRLAEDTGLELFRRTPRGMDLTRDGAALLVKAERVLAALSEFGQTAQRLRGRVHGTLRIGTIVDPEFIRLGQFLASLVQAYPDLRTELSHSMSGEVISRLRRKQIDIGYYLGDLDTDTPGEGAGLAGPLALHQKRLTRITYRVIAPAGWEKSVSDADWPALARLPWIGTPPDSVHSRLLDAIFREHGCTQNRVALVDQEPAMLAMVASGVGLSLCQEAIALNQRQARGIVLAEKVRIDTALSFVTLKTRFEETNIATAFALLDDIWSAQEACS